MTKRKLGRLLAIGLSISVLATGCGMTDSPNSNGADPAANTENGGNGVGETIPSSNSFNNLLTSADIAGTVLEFDARGCKISQIKTDKDGEIAYEADPNHIIEDLTVSIQYDENCEVQIADVDKTTGEADITDGSISDIKKESQLYMFGEFENTHHFNATKIMIIHFE
mgnify:CR=1 FL=1|nr:hypothetical protein [uncultured Sellimonas sp.]